MDRGHCAFWERRRERVGEILECLAESLVQIIARRVVALAEDDESRA